MLGGVLSRQGTLPCLAQKRRMRSRRWSGAEMRPAEPGTSRYRIRFAVNYSIAALSLKTRGRAPGGIASNQRKTSKAAHRITGSESSPDHRERPPVYLSFVHASIS